MKITLALSVSAVVLSVLCAGTISPLAQAAAPAGKRIAGRDIIAVRFFWFAKQEPFNDCCTHYRSGQTVETAVGTGQILFGITNLTAQRLHNIEYRITSRTAKFDSGLRTAASVDAAPGFYSMSIPWAVLGGNHSFTLVLDPNNKLGEAERRNNTETLTLSISLISIKDVIIDTMLPPVPIATMFTAVVSGNDSCRAEPSIAGGSKVLFRLYGPQAPPHACTLNAEIFKGVRVGNGWSVALVQIQGVGEPTWYIRPEGASLHGQFSSKYTGGPGLITGTVRAWLKGPPGTEPSLSYAGSSLRLR